MMYRSSFIGIKKVAKQKNTLEAEKKELESGG